MKLFIIACILFALFLTLKASKLLINKIGLGKSVSVYRVKYITKTINIAIIFIYASFLITYLSIEYTQVLIFLSSIFAVLGVALFATWSILSNITASLIIFFGFPYRVGDHIRVVDKEEDVSGIIEEIALFHVLIRKGDEMISYPNTLILQKAVVKNASLNETIEDD